MQVRPLGCTTQEGGREVAPAASDRREALRAAARTRPVLRKTGLLGQGGEGAAGDTLRIKTILLGRKFQF